MTAGEVSLRRAAPAELDDALLELVYAIRRDSSLEARPEDGFRDFRSFAIRHRERPANSRETFVLAMEGQNLLGFAQVSWEDVPENRHLAGVSVHVASARRRQGLGRRLLGEAAALAQAHGRTLLLGGASTHEAPGLAFCKATGASLALVEHENRLELAGVDRGLLRDWMRPRAGYRVLQVDGPTPDDLAVEVAGLVETMNDAPRGDIQAEDDRMRPDSMQEWERGIAASGEVIWTAYAQHEDSGRLVAFTRLSSHPSQPAVVGQWGTAVVRDHRGHSLGRLVKATNLDRVLRELPAARWVTTTNATSNRWMLAINRELGFRPDGEWQHWQLETSRAL